MALLEIEDIHTSYGAIEALHGISLEVEAGEVVTMIGSNGAGKSTTLRSISGLAPIHKGEIRFDGVEISRLPPSDIVGLGISQAPEGRRCFPRMTVRENLELGAFLRRDSEIPADIEHVFELFPRLREHLLLDEPSMGIAPLLVARIYETISEINQSGTTILLVEQNANYALRVAKRGYVVETGRITLSDDSASLSTNPEVQKAYLGT